MKTNTLKLLALVTLALSLTAASVRADDEPVYDQPFSVSFEGGSLGFGITPAWRFSDHLGVRGGINFFQVSDDSYELEGVNYDSTFRLLSVPIGLDFYPKADSTFRISVGVLVNLNELSSEIANPGAPGTTITIGSSAYDVFNDLGSVDLTVDQEIISPYISVGAMFFLDDAKRWALGGEVGIAYTGSPDASLGIGNAATAANAGFQADRAQEEAQIEDELDKLKVWPIVKFSVTYSF